MEKKPSGNAWVMDYETLSNCFVGCFVHYKTEERHSFVVHESQNQFEEFMEFIFQNIKCIERHVSFNGLAFDAQITEYLIDNYQRLRKCTPDEITADIYVYVQKTIDKSNKNEFLDYIEYKMRIPQLDVFKINNWNNAAKRTSLKWAQFGMNWKNLLDMPIHHADKITKDQIPSIVDYCFNDVYSTKEILYISKEEINLRKTLSAEYKLNLLNASEPKLAKELFLYFLSQTTGIEARSMRDMRTKRDYVKLNEIILPYVNFKTKSLQDLLVYFQGITVDTQKIKGSIKHSISENGVIISYGLGGVHGATKTGIYTVTDDSIIMTSDVKSYYPNLAIKNEWAPAHLPKEAFVQQYAWFYTERTKIPKKDPKNYVLKILLNSTFGLTNDAHCFLYDPQMHLSITVNGQLSLMMLYEMILEKIPTAVPLLLNTDGVEFRIPKESKKLYMEICKDWENITQLELEHDQYQKLIIGDVNNYMGINAFKEIDQETYDSIKLKTPHANIKAEGGKYYFADVKCKGRFQFENLPLNKDKSGLIIPKAIYHFFIHNMSPENYLKSNRNIFDYCIGKRIKGDWKFVERFIEKPFVDMTVPLLEKMEVLHSYGFSKIDRDLWKTKNGVAMGIDEAYTCARNLEIKDDPRGVFKEKDLQKTIRYYASKTGSKVVKINKTDKRAIQSEAGKTVVTVFNFYEEYPWNDYDVDEKYYIMQIYAEIAHVAENNQLSLNF